MKPFAVALNDGRIVKYDVLKAYEIKEGESKQIKDKFTTAYSKQGIVQPPYNPTSLSRLSEKNTFHARCCATKALDTIGQGLEITPTTDEPSDDELDRLKIFLREHNPPLETILLRAAQDYEEIGWACLEIIREGNTSTGLIKRIAHVPAHTIRVHETEKKYVQTWDAFKFRWFKDVSHDKDIHMDTGKEYPLGSLPPDKTANDMIILHNYSSRSSYYGVPDYIPSINSIAAEEARRNYNISFFKNFGVPTYAVFVTGDFEDEEIIDENGNPTGKTYLQQAIEEQFQELARNPHTPLMIAVPGREGESGRVEIRFEKLSTEIKEASFRLYGFDNRDEIITAHGVDPYRVAVIQAGSLGGNTAIQSSRNYKYGIIRQRQIQWEITLNKYLLNDGLNIHDWKLQFKDVDREIDENDLKLCVELFKIGAITPNQVIKRFKERLPLQTSDHPLMNAHYINGQPIDADDYRELPEKVEKILRELKTNLIKS